MPYAVELFFDAATEAALRRLWDALADADITHYMRDRYRPHISLGGCRTLRDTAAFTAALESFATTQADALPVTLEHLGIFPGAEGVVFYGITVTTPLLVLHRRFHTLFTAHAVDWSPYYEPGRWVPHCTLAHGLAPAAIPDAVILLRDILPPTTTGLLVHIALVEIPSGQEISVSPFGAADSGGSENRGLTSA